MPKPPRCPARYAPSYAPDQVGPRCSLPAGHEGEHVCKNRHGENFYFSEAESTTD